MSEILPNNLTGDGIRPEIRVGVVNLAVAIRLFNTDPNVFDPLTMKCPPARDLSSATPGVETLFTFTKPGDDPGDPVIVLTGNPAVFADATLDGLPGKLDGASDGSDGWLVFRTPVGFIDRAGRWQAQAFATLGGSVIPSGIVEFEVFPSLS